ncbi:MAG TPA: hypothetical protein VFZ61_32325, partial [Polyangiales bacterium]
MRRLGLALLLLAGCVSSREPNGFGGESHFLRHCDDECGQGLDCIQGVCTRGCVVGKASCGDLGSGATCTARSVEPGEVGVCDRECSADDDCAKLSTHHQCEAGFCRAPAATVVDAGPPGSDAGPSISAVVSECRGSTSSDPITVVRSRVQARQLILDVSYGGGCAEHAFAVCYEPEFAESYPVQATLHLMHDGNGDGCQRAVGRT